MKDSTSQEVSLSVQETDRLPEGFAERMRSKLESMPAVMQALDSDLEANKPEEVLALLESAGTFAEHPEFGWDGNLQQIIDELKQGRGSDVSKKLQAVEDARVLYRELLAILHPEDLAKDSEQPPPQEEEPEAG